MNRTAKTFILFIHALIGWVIYGGIIGVGRQVMSMEWTLIIQLCDRLALSTSFTLSLR